MFAFCCLFKRYYCLKIKLSSFSSVIEDHFTKQCVSSNFESTLWLNKWKMCRKRFHSFIIGYSARDKSISSCWKQQLLFTVLFRFFKLLMHSVTARHVSLCPHTSLRELVDTTWADHVCKLNVDWLNTFSLYLTKASIKGHMLCDCNKLVTV